MTAVAALALLAGCSGGDETPQGGTGGPAFDTPHVFDSGWVVTVSSPEPVEGASEGDGDAYAVEVVVENGTEVEHQLHHDTIEVEVGGGAADVFHDEANGITGLPDVALAPGEQQEFAVGFLADGLDGVEVVVSSTAGITAGGDESEQVTFRASEEEDAPGDR
jgi:hypothetical protein